MPISSPTWRFSRGLVHKRNCAFLVAFLPELENDQVYVSQIFGWTGDWSTYSIPWPVVSMCMVDEPGPTLLCLGAQGQVHAARPEGFFEESVDDSREGPSYRGALHEIRRIGQQVYAVGMRRQVYRLVSVNHWIRADSGVVLPANDNRVLGFTSIDGADETELYAVGWNGEIWSCGNGGWRECASPTNLKLERVLVEPNGTVFACGQCGVLIRGSGDQWMVIENNETADSFYGMTWFQGRLWVSTREALYVLEPDGVLVPIDFGFDEKPISCGWLDTDDGTMWSIGEQHLLRTTDGSSWTLHEVPSGT